MPDTEKKLKLLVLENTVKHYRVPIFNELAKRCDLTVAYSDACDKNECDKIADANFKIVYIPEWKFLKRFSVQKCNLFGFAQQFDSVVVMGNIAYLWFMLLGIIPFRRYGYTMWTLGVSASYDKKYDADKRWDNVRKTVFNIADSLVFYTDYPKKKYEAMGINPRKMFVAHNTVEVARLPEGVPAPKRDSLLFIGSLYPQKGIKFLLDAYKKVSAKRDLPILNIIGGGGELQNIKNWVAKNGFEGKINALGKIYDIEKKSEYFARSIACISPKQAGLAVQETMGHGVCFVTEADSITGGERFDLVNMNNGVLLSEEYTLENFLMELADNPEKFVEIGSRAREFYDRYRRPEQMADGLWEAVSYAYNKKNRKA